MNILVELLTAALASFLCKKSLLNKTQENIVKVGVSLSFKFIDNMKDRNSIKLQINSSGFEGTNNV